MGEFGSYTFNGRDSTHQVEHVSVDLWSEPGAIHQHQPIYALWIARCEGDRYGATQRMTYQAHSLPVSTQGIEETRQEFRQRRHVVIHGWFVAATRANEVKRADAESFCKCRQVQGPRFV